VLCDVAETQLHVARVIYVIVKFKLRSEFLPISMANHSNCNGWTRAETNLPSVGKLLCCKGDQKSVL